MSAMLAALQDAGWCINPSDEDFIRWAYRRLRREQRIARCRAQVERDYGIVVYV